MSDVSATRYAFCLRVSEGKGPGTVVSKGNRECGCQMPTRCRLCAFDDAREHDGGELLCVQELGDGVSAVLPMRLASLADLDDGVILLGQGFVCADDLADGARSIPADVDIVK